MAINLAATLTSFLIAFLIIPVIIKYSLKRNLVDIPGRRKIHKKITPSMGGIGIFLGFFASSLMWIQFGYWVQIKYVLASLSMICFIGMRDDLVPLKPKIKLLGQILAACILVSLSEKIRIYTFDGLFGIYAIEETIGFVLTVFAIIIITNSFNLIDGLDGLAGTIASISLLTFGIWFYFAPDLIFSIMAFSMLGGVLAFLAFNWEPSKIFMGDTGSLLIGMFFSVLAIRFMNDNPGLADESPFKSMSPIITVASIIIIPLIDTSRIIILRLMKGQSPFQPDKSHIHHAIMRLGLSHQKTTLVLSAFHILYVLLAFTILKNLNENYSLLIILGVSVIFSVLLDKLILKKLSPK